MSDRRGPNLFRPLIIFSLLIGIWWMVPASALAQRPGVDPEKVQQAKETLKKLTQDMVEAVKSRDPDAIKKARDAYQAAVGELRKAIVPGGPRNKEDLLKKMKSRLGSTANARLGATLSSPSETLATQLGLEAGQGQVILQVAPDSAADKAGLKAHDLLIQLSGKNVPSDASQFQKMVNDLNADVPITAVVIRQGKQKTVKNLILP
jgi:serine protease Do